VKEPLTDVATDVEPWGSVNPKDRVSPALPAILNEVVPLIEASLNAEASVKLSISVESRLSTTIDPAQVFGEAAIAPRQSRTAIDFPSRRRR
jgi:hypothetical protein